MSIIPQKIPSPIVHVEASQVVLVGKNLPAHAGDLRDMGSWRLSVYYSVPPISFSSLLKWSPSLAKQGTCR